MYSYISCATQLLQCMDYWTDMLDQGHSVDTIYLDFAKAFDSVPHERLLEKVKGYGIRETSSNGSGYSLRDEGRGSL